MKISNGLRATLTVLGLGFIVLGLFLNFQLYTSLAPTGETLYKGSYALVGLLLDLSKVTLLILGVLLMANGLYNFGLVCLLFYVVLSGISFSAGWGFSLIVAERYESSQAKSSYEYANYQNQLETANNLKARYAAYANIDINGLNAELASLKQSLANEQQTLTQCPANYFKNCIKPAKARINAIQSQIEPLQSQLSAYQNYLSASNSASDALASISALDAGKIASVSTMHPLFIGMSEMFGTSAELAKYRFTFVSFLMVELLGALLYMAGLILKPKTSYTLEEISKLSAEIAAQKQQLESVFFMKNNQHLEQDPIKKQQQAF